MEQLVLHTESELSPAMHRQAERGGYALLDTRELQARLEEDSIMLVDVRDADAFTKEHIPGALCFPLPATWLARLFRRWWIKKILCAKTCKAVAFY